MPVEQLPPQRASALASESKLVKFDQYIDAQIQSTRRMVKLVDLATVVVTLVTSVLAYLFALALIEHWLVPGGFPVAVRFLLFVLLVGGTGVFVYRRLWPLCWRAINPVYAARTIEQSSPSLKNTLVNLLLFRQRRNEVSDAVYHTLEEQAARRLTRVPVDAAVDRGHLIRLGYVLIGVTAFAAVYKIASPKDPVTTAERVLMPWADIVPASRVRISAVEPGDVTIARGEFIKIAAEVRGIGENDPVLLRYTTADGQAVNKTLAMSSVGGGPRFECRLPANGEAGGLLGIGQNLSYHIEAGDARSHRFDVTVVSAPAMMVHRVEYDFPAYTGEADRTIEGSGDVRAIEGTRVTIHARANGPIDEAFVDFDADGRGEVPLTHESLTGQASFVLALRDDRQTPKFSSYVVRFTNAEGRPNQNPAKHSIDVIRDLDPEVTLVAPREKMLDVRLDETIAIEVDARDPDYSLAEVRLRGEALGRPNINVVLLGKPHLGQFTGRYSFTPREHQLRAGDIVQYWVTANDNRAPAANSGKTERQSFRIVAPNPAERQQPEEGARNSQRRQQPGENKQEGKQGGNDKAQGGTEQTGGRGARGERGNAGQPQPDGGQPGGAEPNDGKSETKENEPGRDNRGSAGGGGARSEQNQGGQDRDDQPAGEGSDEKSDDSAKQEGGQRNGGAQGRRSGGRNSGGEQDSEPSPVSSGGDDDSTAFNRIRDHMQRSNQLPNDSDNNRSNQQNSQQTDANRNQQPNSNNEAQPNEGGERRQGNPRGNQNSNPRSGQRTGERREGSPSEGGQEAATKEPAGKSDPAGTNQRVRDEKAGTASDEKREQSPVNDSTGKNEGSPGRHKPDSTGNEGADLPDDTKDSVANRQVNRDGANKTGQSEAANEGAGQADERGAGNDSATRGRDVPSAEKTGQAGSDTAGRGSTRRDGRGNQRGGERGDGKTGERGAAGGDQAQDGGGDSAESKSDSRGGDSTRRVGARGANPGEGQRGDAQPGEEGGADSVSDKQGGESRGERGEGKSNASRGDGKSGDAKGTDPQRGESKSNGSRSGNNGDAQRGANPNGENPDRAGAPTGDGGKLGTSDAAPPPGGGNVPQGDEANLEYARKQTDLVLEKLSDQLNRKEVDNELLKGLGWTEDDLRKFVARWQQRKDAARNINSAGEAARKDLDDALRSLGLRSGELRSNQAPDDALRDMRRGYRGTVPLEYRDRLREYNQGVSRSRQGSGR